NFSTAPQMANAPRVSDILLLCLAIWTLKELISRPFLNPLIWLVIATSALFPFIVWGLFEQDVSLWVASVRIMLVLSALPMLARLLTRDEGLTAFLLGGAAGAILIALISVGQR